MATSWDKTVRFYDTAKNILTTQHSHDGAVLDGCFSNDSRQAFSGGLDCTLRSFDLSSQKQTSIGMHEKPIKSICTLPKDPNMILTGGWDGKVKLWDLRCSDQEPIATTTTGKVFTMDTTKDGSKIIVGTSERQVLMFDINNNKFNMLQKRESALKYQTRCIKCSLDGTGYALSSIEGRVAIEYFDPSPQVQELKYAFKCHRGKLNNVEILYPVNTIAYHPIHGTFATGGCDGMVNIWDGASKKRLCQYHKYPTSIAALSFNRDGTLLAIATSYTFEEGQRSEPQDNDIVIRKVLDIDVKPKQIIKQK
ncbi:mitotic checkpoint protein BUB3 [Acrasis kona]|uniref:Mitotic checkpoint protein BUB3 n=1 Tax=Acrasis kona TaxID=1008807 RepID=A0AAW2ZKP1_9EUKA